MREKLEQLSEQTQFVTVDHEYVHVKRGIRKATNLEFSASCAINFTYTHTHTQWTHSETQVQDRSSLKMEELCSPLRMALREEKFFSVPQKWAISIQRVIIRPRAALLHSLSTVETTTSDSRLKRWMLRLTVGAQS